MQDICINRLDISGSEEDIKSFLKNFHSEEHGFSMSCIIPYEFYGNINWKIINWGTDEDISECSSYKEVFDTYHEENGNGKVSINYLTMDSTNDTFCKNASKIYPTLHFTINYYEPDCPYAGSTSFYKGLELTELTKFYEVDSVNEINSLIDIYEFAIKEKFITLDDLMEPLKRVHSKVREHFYKNPDDEEDDIILDFNELKKDYLADNISKPEGR